MNWNIAQSPAAIAGDTLRGASDSVGRQGCGVGKQRVLVAEMAQVRDAHRIEDAVEMVDLVLHDARVESLDGALERPSFQVEAAIAQSAGPRLRGL